MRYLVPDFETQSACDLKAAGAYRYSVDPTTHILCCSFTFDDDQTVLWWPGDTLPPRVLEHYETAAKLGTWPAYLYLAAVGSGA